MKIASHNIMMRSDTRKKEVNLKGEQLDIMAGSGLAGEKLLFQKDSFHFKSSETMSNSMAYFDSDYMELSDEYKKFLEEDMKGREAEKFLNDQKALADNLKENLNKQNIRPMRKTIFDQLEDNEIRLKKMLIDLLKELFGYEGDEKGYLSDLKELSFENPKGPVPIFDGAGNARGISLSFERKEFKFSQETVKFQATGYVQTEDGNFISLDLNFHSQNTEMSLSRQKLDINKYQVDPLVINLDGKHHGLSNISIDFDLDADGVMDRISFARQGAGFLALDKNGDGIINDGTELFGPESGNGFKDLVKYDQDGNGWIDSNDSVFNQLKIWTLDGKEPVLISLKDAGIGAIHLSYAMTDMQVMNESMDSRGNLRSTGIYLKENGEVGSVQHIDLTL